MSNNNFYDLCEEIKTTFKNEGDFPEIEGNSIFRSKVLSLSITDAGRQFYKGFLDKIEEARREYPTLPFDDEMIKIYNISSILYCQCDCRHELRWSEKKENDCSCCKRHLVMNPRVIEGSELISYNFRDYLNV